MLPGQTVAVDPAADQGAPGSAQQDIRFISIAELGADANTLTFTMQVTDLSSLPANGNWRIIFTAPNGITYFVGMETDQSSLVAYSYGTVSGSASTTTGPADAGTYASDGVISIKIANSKVGNLSAGHLLTAVHGETSLLVGALGTGLLVTTDFTNDGSYTLIGNAACAGGGPTPTPSPTATPSPTPTATPVAADATWTKYKQPMPVERDQASMAFDAARGEIVLFGGNNADAPQKRNDTWTWNGSKWSEKHPATSPSKRLMGAMAFDAARGNVVLFGGFDPGNPDGGYVGDTWIWDGTNWSQQSPSASPSARYGASIAYDAASGTVLLFGGYDNGPDGYVGDTWAWDGSTWTKMPTTDAPSPRLYSQMSADPARNTVVLFGGFNFVGGYFNDTWTWDAPNRNWVRQLPLTSPPGRGFAGMAPDRNGAVVLFGGQSVSFTGELSDTWTWNGTNWTARTPAQSPSARSALTMAYDNIRQTIVLFGGRSRDGLSSDYRDDTWLWDGADWIEPAIPEPPSRREEFGFDYDFIRQETVLFGGWNGMESLGDTWVWDGSKWSGKNPPTSPAQRSLFGMAYDRVRGETVLFGGFSNGARLGDTWSWNGQTWTLRTPVSSPPGRFGGAMVYDAAREKILLFGGSVTGGYRNDTWTWNGLTWTQENPATAPPPRYRPGMSYHSATQTVVLFGGFDSAFNLLNDTWVWNGSTWTQQTTPVAPSARYSAVMADDPRAGQVVLFGGSTGGGSPDDDLGDTWTWDGTAWTKRSTRLAPVASFSGGMAFDAARQALVFFGGASLVEGALRDTWFWNAAPQLSSVLSRKMHGNTGPFVINLPLTGNPGIECRTGGANGGHTLVFKFVNELTSVGGPSASATQEGGGNQAVAAAGSINPTDQKEYIVNLTGVPNAQVLTVSLANVTDSAGNSSASVSASMGVLLGDLNQTGAVDGNDVSAVQATTRQRATSTNFKADVNTSGTVDGNDVSIVQGKTRTRLP